MVVLNRSTCPLSGGSFSVVISVTTVSSLQTLRKHLKIKWEALSISTVHRIPKLARQCSMDILETLVDVMLVIGLSLIRLEQQFIITTVYLFPLSVLSKGLGTLMVTKSRWTAGGNSRTLLCFLFVRQFSVHDIHLATVLWTSLTLRASRNVVLWCLTFAARPDVLLIRTVGIGKVGAVAV